MSSATRPPHANGGCRDRTKKDGFNWSKDTWAFVDAYVKSAKHAVRHHIDSFDHFVRHNVPALISYNSPVRVNFDFSAKNNRHMKSVEIVLENTHFRAPSRHTSSGCVKPVSPQDARHCKLTYASDLVVDVHITTTEYIPRSTDGLANDEDRQPDRKVQKHSTISQFLLGRVPILVNSCLCMTSQHPTRDLGECKVDPGGYFIVNGGEKVFVTVERPADNHIMVYPKAKHPSVDIKSIPSGKCVRPRPFQLKIVRGALGNDVVRVFIPQVRQNIPLWTLMLALGGSNDQDIHTTLLMNLGPGHVRLQADQLLRSSMAEVQHRPTADAAVEAIACHVSSFGASDTLSLLTGQLKEAHSKVRQSAAGTDASREAEKNRARIDKQKRILFARVLLQREVLPHVGPEPMSKRLFIGRMFRELAYGLYTRKPDDDRDSFSNKRLNASGMLMTQIFSQCIARMVRELKTSLNKTYTRGAWRAVGDFHNILNKDNLYRHLRSGLLTKSLRTALSTGNLGGVGGRGGGSGGGSSALIGVYQVLNRLSFSGTLSHLRRVITPLGNTGKLLKPRALHPTQIFSMCPAETPEGHPVGLVKNLALSARVTLYRDPSVSIAALLRNGAMPIEVDKPLSALMNLAPVFVDGAWWGTTPNPEELVTAMRKERRKGHVHPHTSITWLRNARAIATASLKGEVRICGTGGRIVRPMYIIQDKKFVANADHVRYLCEGGVFSSVVCPNLSESKLRALPAAVEYIDISESDTLMVAMTGNAVTKNRSGITIPYTHCELHPSLMFGVLAGIIPFCDHNQSPRNTYQSAMGKQSMGLYATNFSERYGTLAHMLYHPQRPLVQTRIHRILPTAQMPSGQTLIVAIATNGGYNQEDSIIVNKSAVDRGLMVSTKTKTYRCEERNTEGTSYRERICVPDPHNTTGTKRGGYDKLDEDGLAKLGAEVRNGEVIIGKITPTEVRGSRCRVVDSFRDSSVVLRNSTGGIVDGKLIRESSHGGMIARLRIRSTREASIGDKFSSRHGQKGTVGVIRRQSDMPFTASGITPDIIMNPHAIPSRMTVGQLIETYFSKICTLLGAFGDGTPFAGMGPQAIHQFIQAMGEDAVTDEVLYDPTTGKQLKVKVFMGPTFYQKLKHIARDKAHARATGPMIHFTRQPTEGRARDGGLRLGEMERDCLIGHGLSNFLWESMLRRSDDFAVGVCTVCGAIAPLNPDKNIAYCHTCRNKARVHKGIQKQESLPSSSSLVQVKRVEVPYASKLLLHELATMGVQANLKI